LFEELRNKCRTDGIRASEPQYAGTPMRRAHVAVAAPLDRLDSAHGAAWDPNGAVGGSNGIDAVLQTLDLAYQSVAIIGRDA